MNCYTDSLGHELTQFLQSCEVAAASQIGKRLRINFDETVSLKITNKLRRKCNVAATLQVGRKLRINFDKTAMSLWHQKWVENYERISTKLRRRREVRD